MIVSGYEMYKSVKGSRGEDVGEDYHGQLSYKLIDIRNTKIPNSMSNESDTVFHKFAILR
jgi:hypothetical protein